MANNFVTSLAASGSASLTLEPGPERMPIVDEADLRQLYATKPLSGTPRYAAVRPKARTGGGSRQRHEVLFYPTPNQTLTLEYRYSLSPVALSKENEYPHGGTQHAETILQSCLAVAEERKEKARGTAYAKWMERLQASIELDSKSLASTAGDIWPLNEDASDLNITKSYLSRVTGRFLGFGSNSGSWTHEQKSQVDLAVQNGLRKFYHPPLLPGEKYRHEWSFLRPVTEIGTRANVYEYELPADFAIIDGPLIYPAGSSVLYPNIPIVSEHTIRQNIQATDSSGRPRMAAVRPKPIDDMGGTRYEILLWPVPDDTYNLTYRYQRNPSLLPADSALPLGGQPHAQTVLEACLSAGEELGVETAQNSKGLHSARFMECLAASVSHDRNANSPESLGMQYDKSEAMRMDELLSLRNCDLTPVTYNGITY